MFEPVVALSAKLGDSVAQARIALALAPFRDDANDPDPETSGMLEAALEAHREPTHHRAQLLSRLAHVRWYRPQGAALAPVFGS